MTANAAARKATCGGAGTERPSGGGPCSRAAPKTTGEMGWIGGAPSVPALEKASRKKVSERAISRVGPKAKAGLSPVAKGRGAIVGGLVVNLPALVPLARKCSLSERERAFSSTSESLRSRAARGATQGKDHAPCKPEANNSTLHVRKGRRTSRWGTRTRSLGNERRKKWLLSVFITAILL